MAVTRGILCFCVLSLQLAQSRKLPNDLMVGCATSAYQVEGGWNVDGKGESMWDRITHEHPEKIADRSNGDIACDSYHKVDEDIAMIDAIGFDHYRFSVAWTRILPSGFPNVINAMGIQYYNKLINGLIAKGITPIVTLQHFNIPQVLADLGGWTNPLMVKWFEDYARVVFSSFGDRVKLWITINEPMQVCLLGYGDGTLAPFLNYSGIADYMCARNVLMAHATVYHLYKNEFSSQKGKIGISIECSWKEAGSNSSADQEAAERERQFDFGLYAHPIYSQKGGYPKVVQRLVTQRSISEGFTESRLLPFTPKEISYIRRSADFFGLNYYTTRYVVNARPEPIGPPSRDKDAGVIRYSDPKWFTGTMDYMKSVPWGLRKILTYIKTNYQNPEILITESGIPVAEKLKDHSAIKYHQEHLHAMLDAIQIAKVKVKAYTVWSLMDNFEWSGGYTNKFGLYHVNFYDPKRTRTPKLSYHFFKKLMETRELKNATVVG